MEALDKVVKLRKGMIATTYMVGDIDVEEFHDKMERKIALFQAEGYEVEVQYSTSYITEADAIYHSAFVIARVA